MNHFRHAFFISIAISGSAVVAAADSQVDRPALEIHAGLAGAMGAATQGVDDYGKNASPWLKALKESPGNGEAWIGIGSVHYHRGEYGRAITDFTRAMALNADDGRPFALRGAAYLAAHDYAEAAADLHWALEYDDADARAALMLGKALSAQGKYGEAKGFFSKAMEHLQDDPAALDAAAWFLATCPDAASRDVDEAIILATKACDLTRWYDAAPIDMLAVAEENLYHWDQAAMLEGQAIEVAEMAKEDAGRMKKYTAHRAFFKRKKPLLEKRVTPPAPVILTKTQSRAQDLAHQQDAARRYRMQAWRAFRLRMYDQAINRWTWAAKLQPRDARVWHDLATAEAANGDSDGAIVDYGKAIALRPDYAEAYAARGKLHLKAKDADRALADFLKALQLAPDATVYHQCGDAYIYKADHSPAGIPGAELKDLREKASMAYSSAIRLNPHDVAALLARAQIHYINYDWKKAIDDYTVTIEADPANYFAVYCRGTAYAKLGQWDDTIRDETTALRSEPRNVAMLVTRGHACAMRGDYDLAVADFDCAMFSNTGNWSAPEALAWFYSTCPDAKYRNGPLAVKMAEAVCKRSFRVYSSPIDTLATAQAEAGNWDAAVEEEKNAIKKSEDWRENPAIIAERLTRLALFVFKKPYREDAGGVVRGGGGF